MSESSLKTQSALAIRKGSKSFSLSGFILPKEAREDAFLLYMWCRHCDDAIDESKSKEEAIQNLEKIRRQTLLAMKEGDASGSPFVALAKVFEKHGIPEHYPLELINGMEMDVQGVRYQTIADLELYCYRVAGVVGLMMSHIIGVSNEKALKNACDLGMAMQLTNISRDVYTDARMGRVYLPEERLRTFSVDSTDILNPKNRPGLAKVTKEILNLAEKFYRSGDKGVPYLQFRTAVAIQSARYIYAEIGQIVLSRREAAWDSRAHTSLTQKLILVGKAFFKVLGDRILRSNAKKWSPARLEHVVRFNN